MIEQKRTKDEVVEHAKRQIEDVPEETKREFAELKKLVDDAPISFFGMILNRASFGCTDEEFEKAVEMATDFADKVWDTGADPDISSAQWNAVIAGVIIQLAGMFIDNLTRQMTVDMAEQILEEADDGAE